MKDTEKEGEEKEGEVFVKALASHLSSPSAADVKVFSCFFSHWTSFSSPLLSLPFSLSLSLNISFFSDVA